MGLRMGNLQAAAGVAQLERIEEFVAIKRTLGQYYRAKLQDIPHVRFQVEKPYLSLTVMMWMFKGGRLCVRAAKAGGLRQHVP